MTMLVHYPSKKAMREAIGEPLRYTETSAFGPEFPKDGNGTVTVARRPHLQGGGREFFARVTVEDGRIVAVE